MTENTQQTQPPVHPVPPGQWVYVPNMRVMPKAPPSGLRIAAGILSILAGLVALLPAFQSLYLYLSFWGEDMVDDSLKGPAIGYTALAFALGASALGGIVSGIILLALHRSRTRTAPLVAICFAALGLLAYLMIPARALGPFLIGIVLTSATIALAATALGRETKAMRGTPTV